MTPTIPIPVLRARETHRQVRIPKVSEALDLYAIQITAKSRAVFEKVRVGLSRRIRI